MMCSPIDESVNNRKCYSWTNKALANPIIS